MMNLTLKVKEVSDLEFLELYKHSLERGQSAGQDESEDEGDKENRMGRTFKFKIVPKESRSYLEVEETKKGPKQLRMRIYLSNITPKSSGQIEPLFLDKYDFSILHIKNILKCFEGDDNQFKDFKKLLLIMRSWRYI